MKQHRWRHWKWAILGAATALVLVIAGWTGVEYTSSNGFCVSCHSMSTVKQEYLESSHFKNASGVRAECRDCHIPPGVVPTLARKITAVNDLWGELTGTIDTPEKFAKKRGELAEREWARMTANNSATCKSCHRYDAMDHSLQTAEGSKQMSAAALKDSNCIDCHKGIAHQKPDLTSGYREAFEKLTTSSAKLPPTNTLFTLGEKPISASAGAAPGKALLMPATQVEVLSRSGDQVQIKITGWREVNGRGRVLTQYPGKRVFSAVLDDSLMGNITPLATEQPPDAPQPWQQISVTAWTNQQGFTADIAPLWRYAGQMLQANCSGCHAPPPTNRYNANGWIAGLKAMSAYYRLNSEEERTLLKYLQTHASDTGAEK